MSRYECNLVWIDLEMTGLQPEKDTILEIATTITDNNLEIIECGPNIVINHSDIVLSMMDAWNQDTHTKSGLYKAVQESTISLKEAEDQTLEFIMRHCVEKTAPLCGNSVWQDRLFLQRYMPRIDAFLHYRIIDVSSIKEVARRWYPDNKQTRFPKPNNHRACEDVTYSIEELRHYKNYFFIK
jgi:oligoribonuclease